MVRNPEIGNQQILILFLIEALIADITKCKSLNPSVVHFTQLLIQIYFT